METHDSNDTLNGSEIAIIGMSGRFPGADDLDAFWRNLRDGVESIARLTDEDLRAAGVEPAEFQHPQYVKAAPLLNDITGFDAAFFGYTPREAEIMDPQQRVFLECCWEALEHAGYDPETFPSPVGVYAGAKTNTYLFTLAAHRELIKSMDFFQLILGGDLALLSTRISYKLNLKGPSYAVQTACSTSLVAVHLACQSLLINECRMALAGAVAVNVPHTTGYLHQPGGILSPDGHCRAFDADAAGTIFGSGAGVVVLKRLQDALDDGDTIHAVIKGSATNNDGAVKATFTAPSVEGQAAVIIDALAVADVDADTISYVEAHGTGTALGDPIEIASLTEAYRATTDRSGYCAIGSVKTNVGHLDAAAGMSSLLKTVLALRHEQLPPSLHYRAPNPRIDFASSPFYVNTELREWSRSDDGPRRAGVSSFGFGGTNAHVIIEEAPALPETAPAQPWQILPLSAKTPAALESMTVNLARQLQQQAGINLADAAYTLQLGRRPFAERRVVIARDLQDAQALLAQPDPQRVLSATLSVSNRPVAFLFPGQGAQHVGMGRALYEREPVFREHLDRCATLLRPHLGLDLRAVLYPVPGQDDAAAVQLEQTALTQPALFAVEYALAQLWLSWGIRPTALLGHSLGEYVAACLAGVFSLDDALTLVAARGRLMQSCPSGTMLTVPLPESELRPLLNDQLAFAAVNGPRQCVVSGPEAAITALAETLTAAGVTTRRLHTSHAFHSALLDPILPQFRAAVSRVRLSAPTVPVVSNVTGTWLTPEEATDPAYWVRQLREPVRFAAGVATLLAEPERALLEVGPGTTLSTLVRQQGTPTLPPVVASLRHPQDQREELAVLLAALGQLWLQGVTLDWTGLHHDPRRRVPLPTYPFEHQRYWIDVPTTTSTARPGPTRLSKQADLADWFYQPTWERTSAPAAPTVREQPLSWLILGDDSALTAQLVERLRQMGDTVRLVLAGSGFERRDDRWTIDPATPGDYVALLQDAGGRRWQPDRIVHLWNVPSLAAADNHSALTTAQERGWWSLLYLAQALNQQRSPSPIQITVVTTEAQAITADEPIVPAKALMYGACLVLPQEYPGLSCRTIDLPAQADRSELIDPLLAELDLASQGRTVAYRAGQRWELRYAPTPLKAEIEPARLRPGGVYWLIGGLGGIGLTLAEYLARTVQARLVLTSRRGLPPREEWARHLEQPSDSLSRQIRQVQALEALGAEVLVLPADIADRAQMKSAMEQILAHFGALHGVIHAAGTARGAAFKAAQETTPADCEIHFAPKVQGLLALEHALDGHTLDFALLCSSLSAVLGGLGNIAYAAASSFMDAFAQQQRRSGRPWISVDWDSWHQAGDGDEAALGVTLVELAITPDEGTAAFERILAAAPATPIVVSTGPLQARIDQWVNLAVLRPDPASASGETPRRNAVSRLLGAEASGRSELERRLAQIWGEVLGVSNVGLHDNFFDLGGNSLSGMQLLAELKRELDVTLAPVALFEAPTVAALAALISPEPVQDAAAERQRNQPAAAEGATTSPVAIVGLSGRFPGADSVAAFWDNLQNGVESITFFEDEQLREAGIDATLLADPRYVKARPLLSDVAGFDAAFFGYTPREAALMDPQHRLFLECAWEALEHAGYAPGAYGGPVGVYAGASLSTYLLNLYSNQEIIQSVDPLQTIIGNAADSLTTSVSYKLNLKGPSLAVQTFCSTSLVAVHLACQSIQRGECDLALAGGVSVLVPQESGYHYQDEGIVSPDGHCRTFDAGAGGTLFGNGVGVVVLKRLDAAIADGDTIHAVIKGSAINNDGALKVGYTAPSVDGQANVIAEALAAADVDASTISYVEAHGTATALGDPIEIAALTKAYRQSTDQTGYCAIGSVKTNIGHLDRAAGVAALIKTVLALRHEQLPPSLHYNAPNPRIDFASSPFYVNTALRSWPRTEVPRRAGVSALGFGGTNAHVIVEEAPALPETAPAQPWQILPLSAKTPTALDAACANLAAHLRESAAPNLADVAYTLQTGRKPFTERRVVIAQDLADAVALLEGGEGVLQASAAERAPALAFLFPGQGAQHVGMGRALYDSEPVFRQWLDHCARLLEAHLGIDLREVLYPEPGQEDTAATELEQTALTQPALFVIEYALAQLWLSWGVRPTALLGHSLGEYVAACLAGVFSLEDALALVAARGRLMQSCPSGAMLAVPLAEAELRPLLNDQLAFAAVNSPSRCVVTGPEAAIAALAETLTAAGVTTRRLHTSHAFHSALLDPILPQFRAEVARVRLSAPTVPVVSNVTGTWLTPEQATDPAYWVRQLREPVRFAAGVATLLAEPERALLEVGPGTTLSTLVRQQGTPTLPPVVASLSHPQDRRDERAVLLAAAGQLWLQGVALDWGALHHDPRRRVPLPTYPFEHQRYWIDGQIQTYVQRPTATLAKQPDLADWFYLPAWKRAPLTAERAAIEPGGRWLLLADEHGVGLELAQQLADAVQQVIIVQPGAEYGRIAADRYTLRPAQRDDYRALLDELAAADQLPTHVVHLWSITAASEQPLDRAAFDQAQAHGWWSLLYLTQALGQQSVSAPVQLDVVSSQLCAITDVESMRPEKTPVLGLCSVIPQEYPQLSCRSIDIIVPRSAGLLRKLARQLLTELAAEVTDAQIAYRGQQRWTPDIEPTRLPEADVAPLRERGVYLLTGGLAEIGLALAEYLARTLQARLVLVERPDFPARAEWEQWLATHAAPDETGDKIRSVQALEQLGAEVLVLSADVADENAMRAAVQAGLARFGALHGVIYAAGVVGERAFRSIQELDQAECELHFALKAHGLLALDHILDDERLSSELDFCVIDSSLSAFLGGRGYAAYAAGSLFMDAFTRSHNQQGRAPWLSINWDAWRLEKITVVSQNLAQLSMTPEEGGEAFRRILASGLSDQVVVSTAPLQARLDQTRQGILALRGLLQPAADGARGPLHPRPSLKTPYVPPTTDLERAIAEVWQQTLGFEQIGVLDNFFDLGGDSLVAIQVVARMKEAVQQEVAVVSLYEQLTIKGLAELLNSEAQPQDDLFKEREAKQNLRKQYRQKKRARRDDRAEAGIES